MGGERALSSPAPKEKDAGVTGGDMPKAKKGPLDQRSLVCNWWDTCKKKGEKRKKQQKKKKVGCQRGNVPPWRKREKGKGTVGKTPGGGGEKGVFLQGGLSPQGGFWAKGGKRRCSDEHVEPESWGEKGRFKPEKKGSRIEFEGGGYGPLGEKGGGSREKKKRVAGGSATGQ